MKKVSSVLLIVLLVYLAAALPAFANTCDVPSDCQPGISASASLSPLSVQVAVTPPELTPSRLVLTRSPVFPARFKNPIELPMIPETYLDTDVTPGTLYTYTLCAEYDN